jgi:hypothetical protein
MTYFIFLKYLDSLDLQMVLDHLPRDLGHLRWLPCKHIRISPEEGDEREFLFAVQIT